jgi:hypothetical protein
MTAPRKTATIPNPAPLDPAVLRLIEALAKAQAREDHERERRGANGRTD